MSAMCKMLLLSRFYVVLVAFCAYLLGQLFSGSFDYLHTAAGVSGAIVGALDTKKSHSKKVFALTLVVLCSVGLIAVGTDAYKYHSSEHIAGNYYPWFMALPYCGALIVILYNAAMNAPSKTLLQRMRQIERV